MLKKVIHQLSLSSIGGVQRSFNFFLPHAITNSKFQHYIFSRHELIDDYSNCRKFHYNIKKSFINKIKFIFFLFSKNYIVHFYNNLGSNSINKLLTFLPSSNIIFHERGTAWNAKESNIKTYKKNALKAKIIIANSNATRTMLVKRFGIDENKIYVIYNGLFLSNYNFVPKNNKRYSEKISIGYVGRLDTPKAVHVLIEAAKELPNYKFFIAGKGALEYNLKDLAKNFKNINFIGTLKEPLELISKMDIMVVPSIREPFGNVIVEAGFCKKAVIAANIDGIPEIISHNINGVLIDPDKDILINKIPKTALPIPDLVVNPKTNELQKPKEIDPLKLKESIIELASNYNLRKFYGDNLYNLVKKKYNIENYQQQIENIYDKFYE